MVQKSLDAKLARIHADPHGAKDFILADAKDADMAFGLAAPGIDHVTGQPRSLAEFRDQIREIVRQGLVDVMLMSLSTSEQVAQSYGKTSRSTGRHNGIPSESTGTRIVRSAMLTNARIF